MHSHAWVMRVNAFELKYNFEFVNNVEAINISFVIYYSLKYVVINFI